MATDDALRTDARTWFTPWRFAVLLLVLIGATFPEVVTLQKTFFHRDFAAFGYPLAAWQRDCFWRGEMPLWNPLSYCGLPFLAEWNTLSLYPLSLIYLMLPVSWSLGVFCLVHFFLAGIGAYYLARRWTGHNLAATVAGIAFTFNALLLNSLMWPNNMAAFGWMPWVVLLVERAWREGGRLVVLAALAGAMQMLAGAPEVILLTWLTLLAIWLGQFWQNPGARRAMIVRCIVVVVLISGLTAAQLLPFLDLLKYSQRHSNFGDSAWSMPAWGWAQYFVPQFRTIASGLGPRFQPEQAWVETYYMGIGVVALALLAIWQTRSARARLLAVLAAASLMLALGDKALVYSVAKRVIPIFGFMRYPVKFVVLTTFLTPLLAAFAMRDTLETTAPEWPKFRQSIFSVTAGILGIMGGITFLDYLHPYKNLTWGTAAGSAATRAILLLLVIGVLVAIRHARDSRIHRRCQITLLLLLWLDIVTFAPRPNPTVPIYVYEPGLAQKSSRMNPLPKVGSSRVMLSYNAEIALNANPLTNQVEHFYYNRLGLLGNLNLLDELPKIGGSYSLYFHELEQVLYLLYNPMAPAPEGLMDFLGVSQITSEGKSIDFQARPTYLPWLTAGQRPVFADANTTLAGLGSANFAPRQMVYLEPEARALIAQTNQVEVKLSGLDFGDQRVRVETDSTAPSLVVISQNYYHHWQATVDGQPVQLLRANRAFQAVPIPAGHAHVELRYVDPAFKAGLIAGALALLACGVLWFRQPAWLNR